MHFLSLNSEINIKYIKKCFLKRKPFKNSICKIFATKNWSIYKVCLYIFLKVNNCCVINLETKVAITYSTHLCISKILI